MPGILVAIDVIDRFIGIGKELLKLPALVLPQYQLAAVDLYEISQKLLKANENLMRWLNRFLYFDFNSPNARSEFLLAIQAYKTMKGGPEFQQLKFACGDISNIYYRNNIPSGIASWFDKKNKREEVEGIFASLADIDRVMVKFIYTEIIGELDKFIDKIEQAVDIGNLNEAEKLRLEFKSKSRDFVQQLENFDGDLSDLVIGFANIARIPIILS